MHFKKFSSEILCYDEPGKFRLVFEMFLKVVSKQATGFVPELCILQIPSDEEMTPNWAHFLVNSDVCGQKGRGSLEELSHPSPLSTSFPT